MIEGFIILVALIFLWSLWTMYLIYGKKPFISPLKKAMYIARAEKQPHRFSRPLHRRMLNGRRIKLIRGNKNENSY
jgi:hypothetical protein